MSELTNFIKIPTEILHKKKVESRREVSSHSKNTIEKIIQYIESEVFDPDEILLGVLEANFTSKTKRKSDKKRIKTLL